jgi:hypothetical protein
MSLIGNVEVYIIESVFGFKNFDTNSKVIKQFDNVKFLFVVDSLNCIICASVFANAATKNYRKNQLGKP